MSNSQKDFTFKRETEEFQLAIYLRHERDIVKAVILTRDLKTDFNSIEVLKVTDYGEEKGLRKVNRTSQLFVVLPEARYKSEVVSKHTLENTHPGFTFDGFVIGILKDDQYTLEMISERQSRFLNSTYEFYPDSYELQSSQEEFIKAFEGKMSPLKEGYPQSLDMNSELQTLPKELSEFIKVKLSIN